MGESIVAWESLLVHLSRSAALCRGVIGARVMTSGSGPVEEDDFDEFLLRCGIAVDGLSEAGPSVIVIGHEGWDEDELVGAVEARVGHTLRVYSQEMVLVSLALGADVYDVLNEDELAAFGEGHPALEYLSQDHGFEWPTTEVQIAASDGITVDFGSMDSPETGLLRQMGYHVGHNGLAVRARREVLDRVLRAELLPASAGDKYYLEQWDRPMSAKRLQKMANCLASFAASKKRVRTRDYSEAIADWESDLEYLRATYYTSVQSVFRWPSTEVH